MSALYTAIVNGQADVVRNLLERGENPNQNGGTYNEPLLAIAVSNQQTECVRLLLEHGANVEVKLWDMGGFDARVTSLQIAAFKGTAEIVALLLQHGADPNSGNRSGRTPLHDVKTVDIARMLLAHGADVNRATDGYLVTPLHEALQTTAAHRQGLDAIIQVLIDHGANVNAKDVHGETPLLLNVRHGSAKMTQLLLNNGADPNIADNVGWSPLHIAAMNGSYEKADLLIRHGAQIDLLGYRDKKPIALAKSKKHKDIVKLLNAAKRRQEGIKQTRKVPTYDRDFLLSKIRELCYNEDMDPVSMNLFEEMSLEDLMKIYVLSTDEDKLIGRAISKGTCFETDTLEEMLYQQSNWVNPLTREPLREALKHRISQIPRVGGTNQEKRTTKKCASATSS